MQVSLTFKHEQACGPMLPLSQHLLVQVPLLQPLQLPMHAVAPHVVPQCVSV